MSRIRAISIAAVGCVAVFLLAAGGASATTLTSPTGTVATPTIKAESEGHAVLHIPETKCQWAFEGSVESHGEGKPAVVPLSSLLISGCTSSRTVTTVTPGKLKIDWTSGYDGTVTWTEGTIEVKWLGIVCKFGASNIHFGTITGGSPAKIHVNADLPIESGSSLGCGTGPHPLTGTFKLASPSSLFVDS